MEPSKKTASYFNVGITVLVGIGVFAAAIWISQWVGEVKLLRQVVQRLSADSRTAEVLVTKSELNESTGKISTTIKFLEYDAAGKPLTPKYFTFEGNVIQFQSLVIRFQDKFVRAGDKLRGKSAYLFLKAFVLDGARTQEFQITQTGEIPAGYKVSPAKSKFEAELWRNFWNYALDPKARERSGIKNAQLEAPGSLFLPGTIYSIRLEHDGGLRIDTRPIPEILKGESLPQVKPAGVLGETKAESSPGV